MYMNVCIITYSSCEVYSVCVQSCIPDFFSLYVTIFNIKCLYYFILKMFLYHHFVSILFIYLCCFFYSLDFCKGTLHELESYEIDGCQTHKIQAIHFPLNLVLYCLLYLHLNFNKNVHKCAKLQFFFMYFQ